MAAQGVSVEELLRVAQALPEVDLREHAEVTGIRVAGKGFGWLSEARGVVKLKSTLDEQAALVAENPEVYSASWSSGRFGWVEVRLAAADPGELAELVHEAWLLTAPRRLAGRHAAPDGSATMTA